MLLVKVPAWKKSQPFVLQRDAHGVFFYTEAHNLLPCFDLELLLSLTPCFVPDASSSSSSSTSSLFLSLSFFCDHWELKSAFSLQQWVGLQWREAQRGPARQQGQFWSPLWKPLWVQPRWGLLPWERQWCHCTTCSEPDRCPYTDRQMTWAGTEALQ